MTSDPIEIFQKLTEENESHKNVQSRLLQLIECLYKDLQGKTSVVEGLQNQLECLLKVETFGITSKYVSLKEQYHSLNKETITLKNENDDLHTQLIVKEEETKKLLLEREEEMQVHYMNQIKQKEELIKHKEEELQIIKVNHQKIEQELYNEIQAVEASSALQLDQAESNFRKQLNGINKKLKESADTCNILRNELFNTKEQFNEYKTKIVELQRQLRENHSSQQTMKQQEIFLNSNAIEQSPVFEKDNNSFSAKYQPLDINQRNLSNFGDKLFTYKKTPVYRGSTKFPDESYGSGTSKNNKSIPPLMKLNTDNKNTNKKRKLYNPNDFGYLEYENLDN